MNTVPTVKGCQKQKPPPAAPDQDQPSWPLEPSLVPGNLGSLPRLQDIAAAFPHLQFQPVGMLHMCVVVVSPPTHTEAHTEDTDTAGHMGCHRQGTAFSRTYLQDSHKIQAQIARCPPPLQLVDRRSLVEAHTHIHTHTQYSLGSQAYAHLQISQVLVCLSCWSNTPTQILSPLTCFTDLLLTIRFRLVLASKHNQALNSKAFYTLRSPRTPAWAVSLPDTPAQTQGLPVTS